MPFKVYEIKDKVYRRKLIKWFFVGLNMSKLSVCMIVKNEEQYLNKCLESIRHLADEIIIVDTGSNDKTKEIASQFTDKIYDFAWNNDFAEARNFALSKASGDWILSLDADESISSIDCGEIKKAINSEECEAYYLIWRTYTDALGLANWHSSKEDSYPESKCASGFRTDPVLRLFKRGYFFEGKVHETVQNSIKQKGGKIFLSNIIIHHYGELKKIDFKDKKRIKYRTLLEERLAEEHLDKPNHFIFYELASELVQEGNLLEAADYLKQAIESKKDARYLLMLGGIYLKLKEYIKAEQVLIELNNQNPSEDSYNNLGVLYSERGDYTKAIKKFEKAINLNPSSADSNYNLGLVYLKLGKANRAKQYFDRAIELNPIYQSKVSNLSK